MPQKPLHTRAKRAVVWVTGASRGIGYEIAREFAALQTEVLVTSRRSKSLRGLVREIEKAGGSATPHVCDVSSALSVATVARSILARFGQIDVLVNSAGVTYFKSLRDTTPSEFDEVVDTNLRGTFLCIRSVLDSMIRRRSGHIFNIISVAAKSTFTLSGAYSASKAGVLGLTNVLREEVRPYNIKVTAVLPGATDTLMWKPSTREKYRARMMTPRDVAKVIVSVYQAPAQSHIEEIVFRPQLGDLP